MSSVVSKGLSSTASASCRSTTASALSRNQIRCFGALTSKTYAFKARPWELQTINTYDTTDGNFVPIQAQVKDQKVVRILPGGPQSFITDRARFSPVDGLYRNRNAHLYGKSDNNEWSQLSWGDFLGAVSTSAAEKPRGQVVVGPDVDLKTLAALKELSATFDLRVTGVGAPHIPVETEAQATDVASACERRPLWFENDLMERAAEEGPDAKKALVVILGANVKKENVLLHTQFKSAYQKNLAEFVTVGAPLNDNQFPATYYNYDDFADAVASGEFASKAAEHHGDNIHVFYGSDFWTSDDCMSTQAGLAAMTGASARHVWKRAGHAGQVHCARSGQDFLDMSPSAFSPSSDDAFVWFIGVSWADIAESQVEEAEGWKSFLSSPANKGYKTIVQGAFGDDVLAAKYADFIVPGKSHFEQSSMFATGCSADGLAADDLITCTPLYTTSRFAQRDDWDIVQAVRAAVCGGFASPFINTMTPAEAEDYVLNHLGSMPFKPSSSTESASSGKDSLPRALALASDSGIVRNSQVMEESQRELYQPKHTFDGITAVNAKLA